MQEESSYVRFIFEWPSVSLIWFSLSGQFNRNRTVSDRIATVTSVPRLDDIDPGQKRIDLITILVVKIFRKLAVTGRMCPHLYIDKTVYGDIITMIISNKCIKKKLKGLYSSKRKRCKMPKKIKFISYK